MLRSVAVAETIVTHRVLYSPLLFVSNMVQWLRDGGRGDWRREGERGGGREGKEEGLQREKTEKETTGDQCIKRREVGTRPGTTHYLSHTHLKERGWEVTSEKRAVCALCTCLCLCFCLTSGTPAKSLAGHLWETAQRFCYPLHNLPYRHTLRGGGATVRARN